MVKYNKVNQINRHTTEKTENCCQKENRKNLRMSLKMFDGNDVAHELLLTTR